jgi:hypothetical protein
MKIDINNKDNIKEIFESYWIKWKWDIFEVSFDDKQILEEILNIFPWIEYSNEWTESDKLWDIYHQIDNIEIDIMLWRNQWNWWFIID